MWSNCRNPHQFVLFSPLSLLLPYQRLRSHLGYLIYRGASALAVHWFLVISTCILLLVGAGLFSRVPGAFQRYVFNKGVGTDMAELGSRPGSFDVHGNVWHLTYGNPRLKDSSGWSIFQAMYVSLFSSPLICITYCAYVR